MARVKRGTAASKKRKKILKYTKGFRWGRKNKERAAKEALLHAWSHAFRGRKERKRDFRSLWQTKINAALRSDSGQVPSTDSTSSLQASSGQALRQENISYSRFVYRLKQSGIALNRKMLADLAEQEPRVFQTIVTTVNR